MDEKTSKFFCVGVQKQKAPFQILVNLYYTIIDFPHVYDPIKARELRTPPLGAQHFFEIVS